MMRLSMITSIALVAAACEPAKGPAEYGGELAACTATAKARQLQGAITKTQACDESIACENIVRAKHNRPARDASKGCE